MLRAITPTGVSVLGQQHTPVSKTDADTAEATLFSLTIPGGMMGPNDRLRVTAYASASVANATVKTIRMRAGGVQVASFNLTNRGAQLLWATANRNSSSSQVSLPDGYGGGGTSASGPTATTIDFAQDQAITFTAQWGTAGAGSNSVTLESVLVELVRAA